MAIFRALINNTFFILLLLVAVTLYIAFSDQIKKDHGIEPETYHAVLDTVKGNEEASPDVSEASSKAKEVQEGGAHKPLEKSVINKTPVADANAKASSNSESVEKPINVQANKLTGNAKIKLEKSEITSDEENLPKKTHASLPKTLKDAAIEEHKNSAPVSGKVLQSTPQVSHKQEIQMISESQKKSEKKASQRPITDRPTMQKSEKSSLPFSKEEIKQALAQYASPKEAFNAAHQAYLKKDYETAEKILTGLTMLRAEPDLLGLLGNVFYADQKLDWAKKAWAAAVDKLVQHKQFTKAMKVAQSLKKTVPDLSAKMIQRANQAMEASNVRK